MSKLLGVFAHPDDESFEAGGTLAKYAKAGWQVDLVVATKGEQGARGEYEFADSATFAGIRQKELQTAAALLGVSSITFLDYQDAKLSGFTPGEIEDKLVRIFDEEQPDVVITFEPAGGTNNPDNVKLSLATTFAFQKYAEDRRDMNPNDEKPPKLYYSCRPESIVSYLVRKRYLPDESFGKPIAGVDDKRVTTVIDIKRSVGAKAKAMRAHASQERGVEEYLAIPNNPFMKQEYFILRYVGTKEAFMGKNDRVSDRL